MASTIVRCVPKLFCCCCHRKPQLKESKGETKCCGTNVNETFKLTCHVIPHEGVPLLDEETDATSCVTDFFEEEQSTANYHPEMKSNKTMGVGFILMIVTDEMKPGNCFYVSIGKYFLRVHCPGGASHGKLIRIIIPDQIRDNLKQKSDAKLQTLKDISEFLVQVPEGISTRDVDISFSITVLGARIKVICCKGTKPGTVLGIRNLPPTITMEQGKLLGKVPGSDGPAYRGVVPGEKFLVLFGDKEQGTPKYVTVTCPHTAKPGTTMVTIIHSEQRQHRGFQTIIP